MPTISGDLEVAADANFPNLYGYGKVKLGYLQSTPTTVTATSTLAATCGLVILVNSAGATTTTLPSDAVTGKHLIIKNIGAGAATVSAGSGTIDGAATHSLGTQYDSVHLVHNGSNVWYVLSAA